VTSFATLLGKKDTRSKVQLVGDLRDGGVTKHFSLYPVHISVDRGQIDLLDGRLLPVLCILNLLLRSWIFIFMLYRPIDLRVGPLSRVRSH